MNTSRRVKASILLVGALVVAAVAAPASDLARAPSSVGMSDAAFDAAFARISSGHPRLMGEAADFDRIRETAKKDVLLAAGVKAVVGRAKKYERKPPLVRKVSGGRLLAVCRDAVKCITAEAMAYRLTGKRRYLDAAICQLEAVCSFEDWNPCHFLDVAEMSLAVALGYDWLYGDLTDAQRDHIATALKKKGFDVFVQEAAKPRKSRLTAGNNWGQVCNCGAIAAALALWERVDGAAARELVRGSVERLLHPMAVYAPNGAYPEGPDYWEYGTTFNVIALALLERACGTDFGLGESRGFKASAHYCDWMTGSSGQMFNYSDSSPVRGLAVPSWWFAAHGVPSCVDFFERGELLRAAEDLRERLPRTFPCILFWVRDQRGEDVRTRPRVWTSDDETGIAVLRSDWTANACFAAFKYGKVGGPHGHLDVGSFVFDAIGERWAGDIGGEDYTRLESSGVDLWNLAPGSERWAIYRLSNASHNVINPDKTLQNVGETGRLLYLYDSGVVCSTAFDLDAIYCPVISGWKRRASLESERFMVEDVVTGLTDKPVTWGFATKASAQVDGAFVVLTQNGRVCRVRAHGPVGAIWSVAPAQGTNFLDEVNAGWSRVSLSAPAVGGKVVYKVEFVPQL